MAGHPIHPMLIPLPIGLWIFSLVADVVFRAGWGGPVWSDVAFYCLAGGTVGAALAAIPGLMDFLALPPSRARDLGTVHLALNLTIVAIQAIDWWLRTRTLPDAVLPFVLNAVAVGLLTVSGWYGWEMVYRHGVGTMAPEYTIRVAKPRGESGRGAA